VQNQEHFVCHETREAVTDPQGHGVTHGLAERPGEEFPTGRGRAAEAWASSCISFVVG
jgi:hypothetical protein